MNIFHLTFHRMIIATMMTAASSAWSQTTQEISQSVVEASNEQPAKIQGGLFDYSIEVENPSAWKIVKSKPEQMLPEGWDLIVRGPHNGINFAVSSFKIFSTTEQLLESVKQSRLKADPNVIFLSTNSVTIDGVEWKKLDQIVHKPDGASPVKVSTYAFVGTNSVYQILSWTSATEPEADMSAMEKIVRTWKRGPGMLATESKTNEYNNSPPKQLTRIQGGIFDYSIAVENPSVWKIAKATSQQPGPGGSDLSLHGPHNQITFNVAGVTLYKSLDEALEAAKRDRLKLDPNVKFTSTNTILIDGLEWGKLDMIFNHPSAPKPLRMTMYVHSGKDGTHTILYWSPIIAPDYEMLMLDNIARSWKRGPLMLAEDKKIMESADKPLFEVDNSTDYPTSRITGTDYNYSIEIPALNSDQILRGKMGDLAVEVPEFNSLTLVVRASRIYEGDVSHVIEKLKQTYLKIHPDAIFTISEGISIDEEKWTRITIRFISEKMFIRAIVYSGNKGTITVTGGVEGNPVDEIKYAPILDKIEGSFIFTDNKK